MLRVCAGCETLMGCKGGDRTFDCPTCSERATCPGKKAYYEAPEEDRHNLDITHGMCTLCVSKIRDNRDVKQQEEAV